MDELGGTPYDLGNHQMLSFLHGHPIPLLGAPTVSICCAVHWGVQSDANLVMMQSSQVSARSGDVDDYIYIYVCIYLYIYIYIVCVCVFIYITSIH